MTDANDPRLVYITCASEAEALAIARALVEERLAGSVNVLGQARSIYRWQGRIEDAAEVVLVAKTRAGRMDALIARTRALHSYVCPCIVAVPISDGPPDYLAWLTQETTPQDEAGERP